MKKNKSFLISSMIILLLSVTSIQIQAQNRPMRGQQKATQNKGIVQNKCENFLTDLTADQKTKMGTLRTQMQKATLPLLNEIKELEAKLTTLESADKVDMAKINQVIEQSTIKKAGVRKLRAQFKQDVRKILTEEQRVAFDMRQMRKGSRKGMGTHHGRRMGNGNQSGNRNCGR